MVFSPPVQRLALAMASTLVALGGGWLVLKALSDEGATVEFVDDADAFRAELARRAESGEAVVIADAAELGQDFARRLQEDLTEADLFTLFPQLKRKSLRLRPGVHFGLLPNKRWHREFDEHPQGGFLRSTNALGMREDSEAGEAAVDLCVLVMGDSHTEGVCANSESLANRFEHRLRVERPDELIEVWNVAVGGFTPANYLGTLEAYGQLQPHALVLVFYGGNDFRESLAPWRYLYRRPPGELSNADTSVLMEGDKQGIALLGQELHQALGFSADPAAGNDALRLAQACGMELDRQCRERGMRFLFVYLPPPSDAQPERYRERVLKGLLSVGGDPVGLEFGNILADATLRGLDEAGVATLDLRPAFASAPEALYWNTDLHLNLRGHDLAGQLIYQAFKALPPR